jgi:hypothetical protein
VSSGDPCEGGDICNDDTDTCDPAEGIEATLSFGCGRPLALWFGVVSIQGTGTAFGPFTTVRYDSPLVFPLPRLLNSTTQKITQFVLLLPSYGSTILPGLDYPATVEVTVSGLFEVDEFSDTLIIPSCALTPAPQ